MFSLCRLAVSLPGEGSAQAERLEQRYNVSNTLQALQDKHDAVCDLLSQLALEIREIQCDKEKRKKNIDDQVRMEYVYRPALGNSQYFLHLAGDLKQSPTHMQQL